MRSYRSMFILITLIIPALAEGLEGEQFKPSGLNLWCQLGAFVCEQQGC